MSHNQLWVCGMGDRMATWVGEFGLKRSYHIQIRENANEIRGVQRIM